MRRKEKPENSGRDKMNGLKSMICLAVISASLHLGASSQPQLRPILMNTCLITTNVNRLVNFYEGVLGIEAERSGNQYVEFRTGVGVLAIFSIDAQEKYIPGSADAASNKSVILEFKVIDVDHEYARLQPLITTWVKKPTTQPWGTRSVYFRDPDGNLVNFYMPAKID
jgi:catechol 2,3-dioxygenase-like lactoylglutathione lyase family enzyme